MTQQKSSRDTFREKYGIEIPRVAPKPAEKTTDKVKDDKKIEEGNKPPQVTTKTMNDLAALSRGKPLQAEDSSTDQRFTPSTTIPQSNSGAVNYSQPPPVQANSGNQSVVLPPSTAVYTAPPVEVNSGNQPGGLPPSGAVYTAPPVEVNSINQPGVLPASSTVYTPLPASTLQNQLPGATTSHLPGTNYLPGVSSNGGGQPTVPAFSGGQPQSQPQYNNPVPPFHGGHPTQGQNITGPTQGQNVSLPGTVQYHQPPPNQYQPPPS